MQSEPRNAHIPILRWSSPVLPMFGSWTAWLTAWVAAWSATAALLVSGPVGGAMVFHGELVHEEQGEQPAHDDLVHADEEARDHHRHREAEQDRPERAGRHMDGRDLGGGHRGRFGRRGAPVPVAVLLQPQLVAVVHLGHPREVVDRGR